MAHSSFGAQGSDLRLASGRGDFIDELNDAIRQNPLPAVLVGAGLLWMFMGGAKNSVLASASWSLLSRIGQGAQQAGGAAYRGAQQLGGAVADGMGSIADAAGSVTTEAARVRNAAGIVSNAAGESASRLSEAAKATYETAGGLVGSAGQGTSEGVASGVRSVQEIGAQTGNSLQQTLARMFDKQPLLLGAVGIAVGAAIAAAIPSSDVENRLMGETADSLKEKADEVWTETKDRVETMVSTGLEEARSQGLTPEAAGEAMRDVTEKVVSVAEKAKKGVANRIKNKNPAPNR
jgi:hypothetical protein